jgi:tryptophan synthase alpha chain
MSRISQTFERLAGERRCALIPFITAGYPDAQFTVPLLHALVDAGADIVELGVPFSDPMADGPTVQRASECALKAGMNLAGVLEIVTHFRATDDLTPVVLMGYANPIEAFGPAAFVRAAKEAGVDGVLCVDYPPEECSEFAALLRQAGIDAIFLLAPTSTDARCDDIAAIGAGYVYYVSLKGVTGAGTIDFDEVARRIPEIRARVGLPVGVGFGIRDAAGASRIAAVADAVVIGSRLIEEIENSPRAEASSRVATLLRDIRAAMDDKEAMR